MTVEKRMEEQAGFRSGKGCEEQIFVTRQLAEKMIEKDKKLYATFVDLEKPYDKACREELWVVLQKFGVSVDLPRAIRAMYQASEACVKVNGEVTEWFEMRQGVRQGCPIPRWLFNIYLDMVVKKARGSFQRGVTLNACKVQILLFANGTVLVADTEEDLKHNIAALQEAVRAHKLAINWGKTNTMGGSREPMECNVEVEEHSVERR